MTHRNRYLLVGKKRLEIAWHGPSPEEAPTLVFLHEGLGCVAMWHGFPRKLAAATGCGALLYSRLGYGRSEPCSLPRPVRFMHHEGIHVLPELLRAAGIRECILIGHSDGGSIAIIYAGGTPATPLRGLITEAAHVYCEEITVRSIQSAGENYNKKGLRLKLAKYHGDNVDCAFWGWNRAWLHPDFRNWNLEEYLPRIKVPMLAIQGKDDEYATPSQLKTIARHAGTGAQTFLLPDCGHCPHQEQYMATFQAMTNFILHIFSQDL